MQQLHNQNQKEITLIIYYEDQFIFKNEQMEQHTFQYNIEFDPYDYMASARYLYEQMYNQNIDTIDKYIKMIPTKEYIDLLRLLNHNSYVVESDFDHKIIALNADLNLPHKVKLPKEKQILEQQLQSKNQKRYALIIPEPEYYDSWEQILESLYFGMYKEQNEKWEVYLAFKNEFPQIEGLDGCVITGSSSAAYDQKWPWMQPLYDNLQKLNAAKVKVLGICFGHQVLAHALGGKATKMIHLPESQIGQIELGGDETLFGKDPLRVYILHGDEVETHPPGTKVLLKAPHCEIYAYYNEYMLCVQFHPEFNQVILIYALDADIVATKEQKQYNIKRCSKTFMNGDDSMRIWKVMLSFLKNK